MRQQIRFCTAADGVRIAFATHGKGPPIVRASTWLTQLEFDWQSPVWRHWLAGLAEGHTVVRYDERGCGLSDRAVGDFSSRTGWRTWRPFLGRPEPSVTRELPELSPRELEVLGLVAAGLDNEGIAARLYLTTKGPSRSA